LDTSKKFEWRRELIIFFNPFIFSCNTTLLIFMSYYMV